MHGKSIFQRKHGKWTSDQNQRRNTPTRTELPFNWYLIDSVRCSCTNHVRSNCCLPSFWEGIIDIAVKIFDITGQLGRFVFLRVKKWGHYLVPCLKNSSNAESVRWPALSLVCVSELEEFEKFLKRTNGFQATLLSNLYWHVKEKH